MNGFAAKSPEEWDRLIIVQTNQGAAPNFLNAKVIHIGIIPLTKDDAVVGGRWPANLVHIHRKIKILHTRQTVARAHKYIGLGLYNPAIDPAFQRAPHDGKVTFL